MMTHDDAVLTGLDEVAAWVRRARSVVVLTGAGVSTASGIPDYRGPQGLWTQDPAAERLSSIDVWVSDTAVRREGWRRRLSNDPTEAAPNAAHEALVRLERAGLLDTLVTQNVDGLHAAAGTSESVLIEIHGTARRWRCLRCDRQGPIGDVLERLRQGEEDPHCTDCGGLLKTATIAFGQQLDAMLVERAWQAAQGSDVFLAVGTSLTVQPVAGLPVVAASAGARVVIINNDPTPVDNVASVVLRTDVVEALEGIVARALSGSG